MLSAVDYASSNDPFCAKQPLPEREVLTQCGNPRAESTAAGWAESGPPRGELLAGFNAWGDGVIERHPTLNRVFETYDCDR